MGTTRFTSTRKRAFTLVELLVVISVITILAGITLPVILAGFRSSQLAGCLSNLGQVLKGITTYSTAFDSRLPCGGTTWWPTNGHLWAKTLSPNPNCEQPDEPWLSKAILAKSGWTSGNVAKTHAYWYEACMSYINPGATPPKARDALKQKGINSPSRDQIRAEMQRLAGVLTCAGKKQAVMGYGYHYAAPNGVDQVYPCWPKATRRQVDVLYNGFKWPRAKTKSWNPVEEILWFNYPLNASNQRTPVPMLWYNLTISSSVITNPSAQIAVCDTGLVTNDPTLTVDSVDWIESSASNLRGYVRFPLCDWYKNLQWYRSGNKAWRPVPRHGGKTASAMFDCSARAIPIREIVDYEWGDGQCLFDNKPRHEPPIPPVIE